MYTLYVDRVLDFNLENSIDRIPRDERELNVSCFRGVNEDILVSLFKKIAEDLPLLRVMNLSGNRLDELDYASLRAIVAAIPPQITKLDLSGNFLNDIPDVAVAVSAMPSSVKHINLSRNNLGQLPPVALFQLLSSFTDGVESIDLSNNALHNAINLKMALNSITPGINHVNLSGNNLGKMNPQALAKAFAALPSNVTSVDLSDNDFNCMSGADAAMVLAALPKTVTTVAFGGDLEKMPVDTLALSLKGLSNKHIDNLIMFSSDLRYRSKRALADIASTVENLDTICVLDHGDRINDAFSLRLMQLRSKLKHEAEAEVASSNMAAASSASCAPDEQISTKIERVDVVGQAQRYRLIEDTAALLRQFKHPESNMLETEMRMRALTADTSAKLSISILAALMYTIEHVQWGSGGWTSDKESIFKTPEQFSPENVSSLMQELQSDERVNETERNLNDALDGFRQQVSNPSVINKFHKQVKQVFEDLRACNHEFDSPAAPRP